MVIVMVTDMATDHMIIIMTGQDMTAIKKPQIMDHKATTSITTENQSSM